MVEQSLLHVTLNMNHRRRSPRSEVSQEAIDLLSVLIQKSEFLDDAGKVKQPKGLRRQRGFPYLLYVTTQLCGMRFFRGLENPMIIPIIEGETRFRKLLYSPKPRPREREF